MAAPSKKEAALLKEYLARGRFVLAEACCGDKRFDRDFRALMKRLFPGSPLKPLPTSHPVWKAAGKFAVPPRSFPLEGIEKDGRTVVIYSPVPLAGYWEANDHARGREQGRVGIPAVPQEGTPPGMWIDAITASWPGSSRCNRTVPGSD